MKDLFDEENKILEHALSYLGSLQLGESCDIGEYEKLVKEYRRILKLVKRMTRISDKTAVELNVDKLNLQNKVHYDVLTGIFNRRYFEEGLSKAVADCAASGCKISLLMMDVDFFKQYNDTYGHSMGDVCLHRVAQALKESIDSSLGFVARYGGEEFIAILQGIDSQELSRLAAKILKNVADLQIEHEKNTGKGHVTISIGAFNTKVMPEFNEEDYVRYADEALYESKQTGRDKFTLHMIEEDKRC